VCGRDVGAQEMLSGGGDGAGFMEVVARNREREGKCAEDEKCGNLTSKRD